MTQTKAPLPPPEPEPSPKPPSEDEWVSSGVKYGAAGGMAVAALLALAQGPDLVALSAIPTGAGLGFFLGIGLQLIDDA